MILLPNTLSIIRFPLGSIFAVMLVLRFSTETVPWWPLLICFVMIALSDLLDGIAARNFHCQSKVGAVLDVSADSFFILLSLVVLNFYKVIPIWFTVTVILKLDDFIISSWVFSGGEKGHFVFDLLGRSTAVGFYLMPIFAGVFPHAFMLKVAALFLALTAVCSSMLRWIFGKVIKGY